MRNIDFWLLEKHCHKRELTFGKTRSSYKCWLTSLNKCCNENNCKLINTDNYEWDYQKVVQKIINSGDWKLIGMESNENS